MGKKHYGHSHHSHHHHHGHGSPWGHPHFGEDFLFGTCAKDVLKGSDKSEIIFGLRGNDEIAGGNGNDWVIGGRGNDEVDGGPGSDKVFGGKGNDVASYVAAENANANAFGHGDFYDGGSGFDVLKLVLTAEEYKSDAVQADIAAFQEFLADNHNGCGGHGKTFEFTAFDLTVRNFEALEIESGNAPPKGADDTYSTNEDTALTIDVPNGVLANDTDADGDSLTATIVKLPDHGLLAFNDDGSFTYTPEADYFGADGFIYTASDGTDQSDPVNVVIDINPISDPPRLKDPDDPLIWSVNKGGTIPIDILDHYLPGPENESDQTLTLKFAGASVGTASIVGDEIQYAAPNPVVPMTATIGYAITDDAGGFLGASLEVDILV